MGFKGISQLGLLFSILFLLTEVGQAQQPSQSSSPAAANNKRGYIAGRVLGDDGQPLSDVMVNVLSVSRSVRRASATDEEGNFKVNDLPAAVYTITATAPGFVNLTDGMPENSMQYYRLGDQVTISMVKGGVITGKAIDAAGQPLVGAPVSALRVRDADSRPANEAPLTSVSRMTDDRGVYRLYGLPTGFYVVHTGGAGELLSSSIGSRDAPTYYPSATRDTAQEVFVPVGAEIQNIDIRHRGELGHTVSGKVIGTSDIRSMVASSITISLFQVGDGTIVASTNINPLTGNGFALYSVPDGEYEIIAQQRSHTFDERKETSSSASAPHRILVRGKDMTGLELHLAALASIAGRVILEKSEKSDCPIARSRAVEEILLFPKREDREARRKIAADLPTATVPNEKGEFSIRDLDTGLYHITLQMPNDNWYIKAMNVPSSTPTNPLTNGTVTNSLIASVFKLKSGEKLTGVSFIITEGAAGIIGRVESKKLPARLRVHLVPTETEAASNLLRYAEVVTQDGAFSLSNVAPGKYWLLARTVPDYESDEKPAGPVAWDLDARTKLRNEAAAANQVLELKPCQRAKDVVFKF